MTSETRFATGFTSVWRELTPLSDGYFSVENMLAERVSAPLINRSPKDLRAVVNELAFMVFSDLIVRKRKLGREDVLSSVVALIPKAVKYINRLSSVEAITVELIDDGCTREAVQITLRLLSFFPAGRSLKVRPKFLGCGMVTACEGDVILGDCLYEVKAGDRGFRVTDLRQLLIYSALAYASDELTFKKIGLFNPRTGMLWTRSLDEVCRAISGQLSNDVLPKLVEHFTPQGSSR